MTDLSPRGQTWLWSSAGTTSDGIRLTEYLCGWTLPTMAGSNITFQVSDDGSTWTDHEWEGTAISYPASDGDSNNWNSAMFAGRLWVRLVSDASESQDTEVVPTFSTYR